MTPTIHEAVRRWIEIAGVVRISLDDGAVTIAEGVSLDDAARTFWRAVERVALRSAIVFEIEARRQVEASLASAESMRDAYEARAKEAERILAWLDRKGLATRQGQPDSGVECWSGAQRLWIAHHVGSEFHCLREAALAAMQYEESRATTQERLQL
ncbi:MAG TPA: hypothetical protein VGM23_11080 [Armatimonadota bacterium]|jgi:hypothetical protein